MIQFKTTEKLLTADDFNFIHDINGIQKHINRDDNEEDILIRGFLPRCHKSIKQKTS